MAKEKLKVTSTSKQKNKVTGGYVELQSPPSSDGNADAISISQQELSSSDGESERHSDNNDSEDNSSSSSSSGEFAQIPIRTRRRFTTEETEELERVYKRHERPNTQAKQQLADRLDTNITRIQIWFQNRRAKQKKGFNSVAESNKRRQRDGESSSSINLNDDASNHNDAADTGSAHKPNTPHREGGPSLPTRRQPSESSHSHKRKKLSHQQPTNSNSSAQMRPFVLQPNTYNHNIPQPYPPFLPHFDLTPEQAFKYRIPNGMMSSDSEHRSEAVNPGGYIYAPVFAPSYSNGRGMFDIAWAPNIPSSANPPYLGYSHKGYPMEKHSNYVDPQKTTKQDPNRSRPEGVSFSSTNAKPAVLRKGKQKATSNETNNFAEEYEHSTDGEDGMYHDREH